jgi:hypothetical protein
MDTSLLSELTERLAIAVKSGKNDDILPSQAFLESGNKLQKKCGHEVEQLRKQVESGSTNQAKAPDNEGIN